MWPTRSPADIRPGACVLEHPCWAASEEYQWSALCRWLGDLGHPLADVETFWVVEGDSRRLLVTGMPAPGGCLAPKFEADEADIVLVDFTVGLLGGATASLDNVSEALRARLAAATVSDNFARDVVSVGVDVIGALDARGDYWRTREDIPIALDADSARVEHGLRELGETFPGTDGQRHRGHVATAGRPGCPRPHRHALDGRIQWLAVALLMLASACGPGTPAIDGGETETVGDGDAPEADTTPELGERVCVEMSPGQVTCWIGWGNVHARVMLDCQVDELVTGGIWVPGEEVDLDGWGPAMCHDSTFADLTVCLWGPEQMMLTYTLNGWAPVLSAEVENWPAAESPC
jgi:hypothetical protein